MEGRADEKPGMITDEKSVLAHYVLHANMKFRVYSSSKSFI